MDLLLHLLVITFSPSVKYFLTFPHCFCTSLFVFFFLIYILLDLYFLALTLCCLCSLWHVLTSLMVSIVIHNYIFYFSVFRFIISPFGLYFLSGLENPSLLLVISPGNSTYFSAQNPK